MTILDKLKNTSYVEVADGVYVWNQMDLIEEVEELGLSTLDIPNTPFIVQTDQDLLGHTGPELLRLEQEALENDD